MTQPTIDEMLKTLRKLDLLWASTMNLGSADRETGRRVQAIRAILERERDRQEEMKCYETTNAVRTERTND